MAYIYEPTGSARSDAALACNIYRGCAHACSYCYAPSATFTKRERFYDEIAPRDGFLRALEKDAMGRMRRGEGGHVLLCFLCDPYQPIEMELGFTRRTIQILHATGHTVVPLTKGGTRALRDLDLFTPRDEFGTTLTHISDEHHEQWESGAAKYTDRTDALRQFHRAGIPTWVSLEPVLYRDAVFQIIEDTRDFVRHYRIGRLNRNAHAKTLDWRKFAGDVTRFCLDNEVPYFVKKELLPYLPAGVPDVFRCQRP